MGKTKRASRKELDDVVGGMIQEVELIKGMVRNISVLMNMYIEWKGDRFGFDNMIKQKMEEAEQPLATSNLKGDTKIEKQNRYKKISEPL